MSKRKPFYAGLTLVIVSAISLLACLLFLALSSFEGSSDLPQSCRALTFSSNLSVGCKADIAQLSRPDPKLCYDNDKYVSCIQDARDFQVNRLLVLISGTSGFALAIPGVMLLSKRGSSRSNLS